MDVSGSVCVRCSNLQLISTYVPLTRAFHRADCSAFVAQLQLHVSDLVINPTFSKLKTPAIGKRKTVDRCQIFKQK
jgi:hypothetical protein